MLLLLLVVVVVAKKNVWSMHPFPHALCVHVSFLYSFLIFTRGALAERAARLFSLKGLQRKDFPKKVRAKGFLEY
jgi:hypothetical protein